MCEANCYTCVMKDKVFIIIPAHNRKSITLKCLDILEQNGDLAQFSVIVVDDGSTDGTSTAIQEQFPQVYILKGDGNLWWTGAICMGMKYAIAQGAEYIIWLNDDCYPKKGTLEKLLIFCQEDHQLVVGGNTLDYETGQTVYSGFRFYPYPPTLITALNLSESLVDCDGLNGNIVCFHKSLINTIGYPNYNIFPHYGGDIIYTFKAKKDGFKLRICPSAIAFSDQNHTSASFLSILSSRQEILENVRQRFNIKSATYWKADLGIYWVLYGIKGVLYRIISVFTVICLVILLPKNFREYLQKPVMNIYNRLRYVL
jgi:GT2 family glycosyltransferase